MYKGNAIRYLSVVSQLAPSTAMDIFMAIRASAESAVEQCEGEEEGRLCGFYWATAEFVDPEEEDSPGAGEEMNVLAAVSSLLITDAAPPATSGNDNDDNDDSGNDGQDSDNDGGDSGDSGDDSEEGGDSEGSEDGDDGDSGAMGVTLSASVMMGGLVASLLMSL
jgi:mannan endo-1,6-alpha-mannosidase